MYKRILLAYDGSDVAQGALIECVRLAAAITAEVHMLAVVPAYFGLLVAGDLNVEDNLSQERMRYRHILDAGLDCLQSRGHTARGQIAHGEPVEAICSRARDLETDLICVGHRQANGWAQRWWHGYLGKTLIEHAPCSVLIAVAR